MREPEHCNSKLVYTYTQRLTLQTPGILIDTLAFKTNAFNCSDIHPLCALPGLSIDAPVGRGLSMWFTMLACLYWRTLLLAGQTSNFYITKLQHIAYLTVAEEIEINILVIDKDQSPCSSCKLKRKPVNKLTLKTVSSSHKKCSNRKLQPQATENKAIFSVKSLHDHRWLHRVCKLIIT